MTAERKSTVALPQTKRPLQNRVDPFGDFHAVAARGAMMGNRGGRLHRDDRALGSRRWTNKRWIVCVCAFKGRWREVWGPGYTELFFLDEPTALAAGHRPCFECRREAAKAFLAAFPNSAGFGADAMDEVLHRERLADGRKLALALPARRAAGRRHGRMGRRRQCCAGREARALELRGLRRAADASGRNRGGCFDAAIDSRGARGGLSAAMARPFDAPCLTARSALAETRRK